MENINSSLYKLNNKRIVTHSLLTDIVLTKESKNLSTYNNRKISDYDLILVVIGPTITDIRDTKILSARTFSSSKSYKFNLSVLHGSNSSDASDYKVTNVAIQYVDDTTINVKLAGSGMLNHLEVFGIKLE